MVDPDWVWLAGGIWASPMPHHHGHTVVLCQCLRHRSLCPKPGCAGDNNTTTMTLATPPAAKAKVDCTQTSASIVQTTPGTGVVVSRSCVSGITQLAATCIMCALFQTQLSDSTTQTSFQFQTSTMQEQYWLSLILSNSALLLAVLINWVSVTMPCCWQYWLSLCNNALLLAVLTNWVSASMPCCRQYWLTESVTMPCFSSTD